MTTAKKHRPSISGGFAIRNAGWLLLMRPTGSRLPWKLPLGGRFPGKKLPHSASANGRKLSPVMCVSAVGKSSTETDSDVPNARSSSGTSGSTSGPEQGDITAV